MTEETRLWKIVSRIAYVVWRHVYYGGYTLQLQIADSNHCHDDYKGERYIPT